MDDDKVIPDVDFDDMNHKFIWDCYGYKFTDRDFKEIERIITERNEDHLAIDESKCVFIPLGNDMYQPRPIPEHMKKQAHKYVDWSAGCDILLIVSKYVDIYSKEK